MNDTRGLVKKYPITVRLVIRVERVEKEDHWAKAKMVPSWWTRTGAFLPMDKSVVFFHRPDIRNNPNYWRRHAFQALKETIHSGHVTQAKQQQGQTLVKSLKLLRFLRVSFSMQVASL
jgi:hypothetical protein